MPTIPPDITPVPTPAPVRGDKATFRGRVDAFITWLSTGVTQLAAAVTNCYNNAVSAYDSAVAAAASAANAAASANVTVWVSGTTYVAGDCRWSPIDFLTYRRKTNGAGTTDPSADSTNWRLLFDGYVHTTDKGTLTQNSQSADYTLVLTDGYGKHLLHPSADTTARTFTIPANASVAFPSGTRIPIVNQVGAGKVNIGITTDTLQVLGNSAATSLDLYAGEEADLLKISETVWEIGKTKSVNPIIILRDEKANGNAGGTCTAGAFETRTLNTKLVDTHGICTLSSDQFTIPAGIYKAHARASGYKTGRHKACIKNITDAAISILGENAYSLTTGGVGHPAHVEGIVSITAEKTFALQSFVDTTSATDGYGIANSFGAGIAEIYSNVVLEKIG